MAPYRWCKILVYTVIFTILLPFKQAYMGVGETGLFYEQVIFFFFLPKTWYFLMLIFLSYFKFQLKIFSYVIKTAVSTNRIRFSVPKKWAILPGLSSWNIQRTISNLAWTVTGRLLLTVQCVIYASKFKFRCSQFNIKIFASISPFNIRRDNATFQ